MMDIDIKELFYYQDGRLFNRTNRAANCKKDMEAGSINNRGYREARAEGGKYLTHRIIWIMHHGEIPNGIEVDHINHDRADNRIENLRLVSHQDNHRNRSMQSNNTSGVTGVYWHKAAGKWLARVKVSGKHKHLGYFEDLADAELAVTEARKKHGFHNNHGRVADVSS